MEESVDVHLASYQRIWAIHGVWIHHLFTSQIWPFWPSIRWTWLMGGYLPLFSTKIHHETQKIKLWKMMFKAASWFIGSSHKFLRVHTWLPNRLTTCFPFVAHLLVENPLNFRSWARWRSIENDMFHHLCNVLVAYQAPAVEMTRNSETLMRCNAWKRRSCELWSSPEVILNLQILFDAKQTILHNSPKTTPCSNTQFV